MKLKIFVILVLAILFSFTFVSAIATQIYDDFEDNDFNTTKWTSAATGGEIVEHEGLLTLRITGGAGGNIQLLSNETFDNFLEFAYELGSCAGSVTVYQNGYNLVTAHNLQNYDYQNITLIRNMTGSLFSISVYNQSSLLQTTTVTKHDDIIEIRENTGTPTECNITATYQNRINLTIDLLNPESGGSVILPSNFSVNITTPDYTLINATFYVWDSSGVIVNQTTITISGNTNTTELEIVDFGVGNFVWNVFACANFTNIFFCRFASSNVSFSSGFEENVQTFNSYTYETKTENFKINISYDTAIYTNAIGTLIYNGTSYLGDKTAYGNDILFNRDIDIPISAVNRSFYWQIALINATATTYRNSSWKNQTINPLHLVACNSTYPDFALNFTFYDEGLGIKINSTLEATFNFWSINGTGSVKKNFSYQNLTQFYEYDFCIYPENETFIVDMDSEYSADGYSPRTYFLNNASVDNETNAIFLYLLNDSTAVKFYVEVLDRLTAFAGATVTVSKYFVGEGVYKTVGIRETDENGEFIEYLELDKSYQFAISRDGTSYGTITRTAVCSVSPCEMTLQITTAAINLWSGYYNLFATNIAYNLYYNETTSMVTYTFNDLTGLAQYFRLGVTQIAYNQTSGLVCNNTLYATSGALTCNLTDYSGDFRATGYVSRSPELTVSFLDVVKRAIKDVLGLTGVLIAMFLIITIGLVGAWSPSVGVILTSFSILMMKILGFVAFGWTSVTLIFVLAIILIVKIKV